MFGDYDELANPEPFEPEIPDFAFEAQYEPTGYRKLTMDTWLEADSEVEAFTTHHDKSIEHFDVKELKADEPHNPDIAIEHIQKTKNIKRITKAKTPKRRTNLSKKNPSTPQHLKTSTPQRLNTSTPQHLNTTTPQPFKRRKKSFLKRGQRKELKKQTQALRLLWEKKEKDPMICVFKKYWREKSRKGFQLVIVRELSHKTIQD